MDPLAWTLLATVAISLTAWVGALTLFLHEELLDRLLLGLVALAAGSLIGGAFLHLLPRAVADAGTDGTVPLFMALIAGFCLFYVLEGFLGWHHHHAATHDREPVSYLVLVSDSVHNFIDGLVIAGAFLVDVPLGVTTTLVVALHEIPQEIGDFGVLVYGGFSRRRALVLNYLTQVTVVLGGVVGFLLDDVVAGLPGFLLSFAAGNFVYIASSDLIPEIKGGDDPVRSALYFLVFLLGVTLMLSIRLVGGLLV